ncbi:MAG: hypothetical protein GF410_14355, partial [Chitinivibrionales bacterium]|nr:hypothetical protein [Chitinivibrionales bacterium]
MNCASVICRKLSRKAGTWHAGLRIALWLPAFLVLMWSSAALADASTDSSRQYPYVDYSGGFDIGMWRIVKSSQFPGLQIVDTNYYNGLWQQSYIGWLGFTAHIMKRLSFKLGVWGGIYHAPQLIEGYSSSLNTRKASGGLASANGTLIIGPMERPWLTLTAGDFRYQYNPDAKNLGRYLLTGGTYPGYLMTDDPASAVAGDRGYELLGLMLQSEWMKHWRHDLIASIETEEPAGDVSLSYVATYRRKVFELGAGIAATRLLQIAGNETDSSQDRYGSADTVRAALAGDTT